MSRTARRLAVVAGAALVATAGPVFVPTAAYALPGAGLVYVEGNTLYFEPEPGWANDVELGGVLPDYWLSDTAAPLLAVGPECDQVDDHTVTCSAVGVTGIIAALGAEDDSFGVRGTLLESWISGEGGNDLLEGGNGGDTIIGGSGNDTLRGWAGADEMFGGQGNDTLIGDSEDDVLVGGPGADTMYGGPGEDVASYEEHVLGIKADPDGAAGDDGSPGEGDTLAVDVETIRGTPASDYLVGNSGPNRLMGNGGDDTLIGGPGSDLLYGGPGFDSLFGDALASPPEVLDWDMCMVGPGGGSTAGCEVVN
jgi:Ca2+-binding RTX toxin-like protein